MAAAYLGLGSNVGERRASLEAAVEALGRHGARVIASSSVYETDPVGELPDQPPFLNACLRVDWDGAALDLLDICKEVERELGREPSSIRHAPRPIDVDLVLIDGVELRTERLSLPHGELLRRRFVLIPLLELDFELCTPAGVGLADALAALPLDDGVRLAGPPLVAAGR